MRARRQAMSKTPFIQVIVPLRLEWEPWYCLEEAVVGERVKVSMAGREYTGVVSAVDVTPNPDVNVLPATRLDLAPVDAKEIAYWRALANYYLCTVGEVYKAAYPELRQESDVIKARTDERLQKRLALLREKLAKAKKVQTRERYAGEIGRLEAFLAGDNIAPEIRTIELTPAQKKAAEAVRAGFQAGKTVLLQGEADKTDIYLSLAQETLAQGRSVLFLVPEIGLFQQLEARIRQVIPSLLVYHSGRTSAQKRAVADALREEKPQLVLGTRSALFLPHRNLGLIILDQEHETSYKQDSPAPRYHARESAILLAGIHRAAVVLGSQTPSLESLYNADNGLFIKVNLEECSTLGQRPETLLINTAAETWKKGMVGTLSLKLLEQMHRALDAGQRQLIVCRSKAAMPENKAELEAIFGAHPKGLVLTTPASAKEQPPGSFGLTAVLQADGLLTREDFRCDERAHQLLSLLAGKCLPGGIFVIQTREAAHPVFGPYSPERIRQLLEERRQFGYPPFKRLIHVSVKDNNEKRGNYMARELADALRREILRQEAANEGVTIEQYQFLVRILLPRDKALLARKQAILAAVSAFEKERRYIGHIVIDVDPV